MNRMENQANKTENAIKVKKVSPAKETLAGALAGALSKTAVAPVERVKLLMQLKGSISRQPSKSPSSAFQVAHSVYVNEGIFAFWRGNTPNILRQAGTSGLNFMLMDHYKRVVNPIVSYSVCEITREDKTRQRKRALVSSFLSGGLAGEFIQLTQISSILLYIVQLPNHVNSFCDTFRRNCNHCALSY